MALTVTHTVSVEMRVNGQLITRTYDPGDVDDMPAEIAELLIAQGLAKMTTAKPTKNTAPARES